MCESGKLLGKEPIKLSGKESIESEKGGIASPVTKQLNEPVWGINPEEVYRCWANWRANLEEVYGLTVKETIKCN